MSSKSKKASLAGAIIALGIVYGDIGTSPLYVMNSIIGGQGSIDQTSPSFIYGVISLIFWTLMIITTIKYVIITMKADNNGEGGIFALYALVKKHAKWLVWIALIGGAALLADGTLTPAVTVTSSIEGLKGLNIPLIYNSQENVLIVVTCVLLVLFSIQHLGTGFIGKAFGPVMTLWFSFLAITGVLNLLQYPSVLKALSPIYAFEVLFSPENKTGIFILGSIFLATTGAEALYSDMGHVGKNNIYLTWPMVYTTLILNYLGQGAWMINHEHSASVAGIKNINPFYMMIPSSFRPVAVGIAALAAIIASQALITGSYTLVDEAIGLKFLPRLIIKHTSNSRSQIYIATVNWLLCAITLFVVWFFKSSQKMEAAYGLAITVTMLMTTVLLYQFLAARFREKFASKATKNNKSLSATDKKLSKIYALIVAGFFAVIEAIFLMASLVKFIHGGYVTLGIMLLILGVMLVWYLGNRRRVHYESGNEYVSILDYRDQLQALSKDTSIPLFSSNVIYMTKMKSNYRVKKDVMASILSDEPKKRAKVYWFVTVNETNVPYESNYTVDLMNTNNIVDVQLYLGFRKSQSIDTYINQISENLIKEGYLQPQSQKYSLHKDQKVGDFKYVLIEESPSDVAVNANVNRFDRMLIGGRLFLQNYTASPVRWFGLQFSNVVVEDAPLFMATERDQYLVQRGIKNGVKNSGATHKNLQPKN